MRLEMPCLHSILILGFFRTRGCLLRPAAYSCESCSSKAYCSPTLEIRHDAVLLPLNPTLSLISLNSVDSVLPTIVPASSPQSYSPFTTSPRSTDLIQLGSGTYFFFVPPLAPTSSVIFLPRLVFLFAASNIFLLFF
jgi:hypothetical protein